MYLRLISFKIFYLFLRPFCHILQVFCHKIWSYSEKFHAFFWGIVVLKKHKTGIFYKIKTILKAIYPKYMQGGGVFILSLRSIENLIVKIYQNRGLIFIFSWQK